MIKMSIKQDLKKLEELRRKIPKARERYVKDKGDEVVFEAKYRLIVNYYPPASKEGEPPHIRTGDLWRSIKRSKPDTNGFETRIFVIAGEGLTRDYARYLELGTRFMAARPFLRPALRNVLERSRNSATLITRLILD